MDGPRGNSQGFLGPSGGASPGVPLGPLDRMQLSLCPRPEHEGDSRYFQGPVKYYGPARSTAQVVLEDLTMDQEQARKGAAGTWSGDCGLPEVEVAASEALRGQPLRTTEVPWIAVER